MDIPFAAFYKHVKLLHYTFKRNGNSNAVKFYMIDSLLRTYANRALVEHPLHVEIYCVLLYGNIRHAPASYDYILSQ